MFRHLRKIKIIAARLRKQNNRRRSNWKAVLSPGPLMAWRHVRKHGAGEVDLNGYACTHG
jgi:hypothetical protein